MLSKDLLARKIYKVDIFVDEKFKRRHPVLATQVYIFAIRHATFISNAIQRCQKGLLRIICAISQEGYLSRPLIPGCNTFTATVCNFLARGLAGVNSSLSSRALSEIVDTYRSYLIRQLLTSWACFNSNKFKKVGIIVRL